MKWSILIAKRVLATLDKSFMGMKPMSNLSRFDFKYSHKQNRGGNPIQDFPVPALRC